MKSDKNDISIEKELLDDCRTMLPRMMLSLKSEVMDCRVSWCRFVLSSNENIARKIHRHLVFEMHYILSGEIVYNFPRLGIEDFRVKKGHFILIPEGVLHSTADGTKNQTEYLVIAFSFVSDNDTINVIFSKNSIPTAFSFSEPMVSLIHALKVKKSDIRFPDSMSTKLIVHSIILEAVDCIVEELKLYYVPERQGGITDKRINDIIRIVSTNTYNDRLNGEYVAEQLGITTRQLNRICNRYFGYSINNLIIKIRIQAIQTVLESSDHSLSDIAEVFGFSDVYAFIRHFTHFTGMTPGAYRKEFFLKNKTGSFAEESSGNNENAFSGKENYDT